MNIKKALSILIIAVAAALTVVSFIFLPDTVVTQLSIGGSGTSTMPKLLAVLLPAALGIGGGVAQLLDRDGKNKGLVVSLVGLLVFAIMLIVNL